MKSETMNIVIAVNPSYVPYAYIMLSSLLANNPHAVNVYVLHHNLTQEDKQAFQPLETLYPVTFHYLFIPDSLLPPEDVLSSTSWGIETYFRLVIIDLIPENVERVLYLDSDMIVNQSLDELYFHDFDGKKLIVCPDFHSVPPFNNYRDSLFKDILSPDFRYFNAGLILFHLDALRGNCCFKTYMDAARNLNYQIEFPDQDLLNYCHHDDFLLVDGKRYNLFARRAFTDYHMRYKDVKSNVCVVHYTNSKPWEGNCLHCEIEQLWWDYAEKTPFCHNLMEHMLHQIMFDTSIRTYAANLHAEQQQLIDIKEKYKLLLENYGIQI